MSPDDRLKAEWVASTSDSAPAGRQPLGTEEHAPKSVKEPRRPTASPDSDPHGVRLVVVDVNTLRAMLRELLREMLSTSAAPDFYSQTCLPPAMNRRAFLEAIRRGDLPARAYGKQRFVARADFLAFVKGASPVRAREKQPTYAGAARAVLRASQGKR